MSGKIYRLREFIDPQDNHSLVVDSSAGLEMGPLPGLEQYPEAVTGILPFIDGLVSSPGQARRLPQRNRGDAALLVRGDWSNALRGPDFVLPQETVHHLPILTPQDALDLGASALVLNFFLGHEEEIEAGSLRRTVQSALEGARLGMPLIVDVQPVGPRVVHFNKAVELGVSYAIEGGADGVAVPWPGEDSFRTIRHMAGDLPVWVKANRIENADELSPHVLDLGGTGLWLGEWVFAQPDPGESLRRLQAKLHQQPVKEAE